MNEKRSISSCEEKSGGDMGRIPPKVAVVTGASSGIGFATAEYLAERGFTVYGLSRRKAQSAKFHWLEADVCDHEQLSFAIEEIHRREGKIDALINNAGMGISGPIEETTTQMIKEIFAVNVNALVDACAVCLPYLRESRGRIVNMGSVGGVAPLPYQACYSASKSAVEVFSYALAGEVAKHGVKVICVRPGDTRTGFTDARVKAQPAAGGVYEMAANASVTKMEEDERRGRSPVTVAKVVHKSLVCKNPSPVVTVGLSYKVLCILAKFLPQRIVNKVMEGLYG